MFYKKIKQGIFAIAIATSITSATVMAEGKLLAKTVKTKTGQVVTFTNSKGKVLKKVAVTKIGNVTTTVTIVYDESGKQLSKTTVASSMTSGGNPKLIRSETYIENADGTVTKEVTDVTTNDSGVTTTKTNSTTTKADGTSTSTDSVTTTNPDGKSTTSKTVTTTAADGTTTTKTSGGDAPDQQGGGNAPGKNPSEGDGAGSYTPSNSYKNTP